MNNTPPARWAYILQVYEYMKDHSIVTELPRQSNKGDILPSVRVWKGFTTKTFAELGIPQPYYGKILRALTEMGCIQQLRRGGRTSPSEWAVFKTEPDLEVFEKLEPAPLTKTTTSIDRLNQSIADIREALGGIDIPKAMTHMQVQLDDQEERLRRLEDGEERSVRAAT